MKYVTAYNDHRSVELAIVDFREYNPWRVDDPASVTFGAHFFKAIIPPEDK